MDEDKTADRGDTALHSTHTLAVEQSESDSSGLQSLVTTQERSTDVTRLT